MCAQSCPTLCDPMDCSPPGSSDLGIFQARTHWSGLPFPPPGDLPNPGIEPTSLMSPALAGGFFTTSVISRTSLVALSVKSLPAMQETWVRSLGWKDPLEEGMATHSRILAWEIPWTEKPGRIQPTGLQRVGYK